jgi:hypothetical protein
MQVTILPEVLEYFENLAVILYEKEYFGFEKTALTYVIELYDDIVANLPTKPHKPAPVYFDKYGKGMKYAVFRRNRRTSWYAFFNTYHNNVEPFYVVRYIANNHIIAQYL